MKLAGIAQLVFAIMCTAQPLPPVQPAFDVASIKPALPDERGGGYRSNRAAGPLSRTSR